MKTRCCIWILGLMMLVALRVQGVESAAPEATVSPLAVSMPVTSSNTLFLDLKQNVQTADQLIQTTRKQLQTLTRLQKDWEQEKKQQRKTDRLVAGEARELKAVRKEIETYQGRLTQLEKQMAIDVEEIQRLETIQAEYETIKSQRQQAQARLQTLIHTREDGEKTEADLKKKVAAVTKRLKRLSKPAGSVKSLQAELEQQKQLRVESDAACQRHTASCVVIEQAIADLTVKLAEAQAREKEIQQHDQIITQLKADVAREEKQQEKSMLAAEQATIAAEEAEKELLQLKMKWNDVAKQVAAGAPKLQVVQQIQAELENVKTQRLTSEARVQQAEQARETAVKSIADLKRQIADAEKQVSLKRRRQNSEMEPLRKKLEQEKKLQAEATTAINRQSAVQAAQKKEIAGWNVKLADLRQRQADAVSGTNMVITQLQAELEQARQSRVAMEARLDNERQALETAGKTLDNIQREWKAEEQQLARTDKQVKIVREIQSDLDKEKQLNAKTEVEVEQYASRRVALEKEMAELKTRLAEAEQQQAGARQQVAVLDKLQAELDREIKIQKAAQVNVKRAASAGADAEKKLKKIRAQYVKTQKQSGELSRQLERLDQLRVELEKAEQARRNAEAAVNTAVETRAAAEKEMKQMKSQLTLLEKQLTKKEAQVRKLAPLQAELEKAKIKTQEALAAANLPRDEMQQKIQALQVRLTDAEKQYAEKTEQVKAAEAIQDQLGREKQLQASADKRARGFNREWKRLEHRAADLAASLRKMEGRIAQAEQMLQPAGQLKLELEKARQAHQQTVAKIQADTNTQACLEVRLTSLAGKTESLSDLLDTMNQQIKSSRQVQSDLAQERAAREATEAKLKSEAAGRKDLERQLKTLGDTVADLNNKLSRELARKPAMLSKAEQAARPPAVESAAAVSAPQTAASEDTNVLAAEQRIVAAARARGAPVDEQATATEDQLAGDLRTKKQMDADRHYQSGIQKWDQGDIDGAIVKFKKTVFLNPDAAGAYYNLGLAYLRNDNTAKACSYAYQAGRIYLKEQNIRQAWRMLVFLKSMDSSSRLINKLRKEINTQSK